MIIGIVAALILAVVVAAIIAHQLWPRDRWLYRWQYAMLIKTKKENEFRVYDEGIGYLLSLPTPVLAGEPIKLGGNLKNPMELVPELRRHGWEFVTMWNDDTIIVRRLKRQ